MAFTLPELGYSFVALEPYIDARTMEIHHGKHHAAYVAKLNAALEGTDTAGFSIEDIINNISKYSTAVRNNGGGHYNHSIFWKVIAPGDSKQPTGEVAAGINTKWGNFENFKKEFSEAAGNRFGSGWAWLCVNKDGGLSVCSTANQDNPSMDLDLGCSGSPILGLDVWEHAYYLNYQNRRPDYVDAFFKIVNWDEVARRYAGRK
jgi:Fe-Mn family superoxide dismutase